MPTKVLRAGQGLGRRCPFSSSFQPSFSLPLPEQRPPEFNHDAAVSLDGAPTWGSAPLLARPHLRLSTFIGGTAVRRQRVNQSDPAETHSPPGAIEAHGPPAPLGRRPTDWSRRNRAPRVAVHCTKVMQRRTAAAALQGFSARRFDWDPSRRRRFFLGRCWPGLF
jgi:hypothetical protein